MSDKLDMIYDLLKQDREDASDFRKEVRDSHKSTGDRLGTLEAQGQIQNTQLADHIRRTELLEDLHGINASRLDVHDTKLEELEKPKIVMSVLKKWIIGIGAVAGSLVGIAKFFELF